MNQFLNSHQTLLNAQGARILSELNDLKRTADSCANEIGWDPEEVACILKGDTTLERMLNFMDCIVAAYPINRAELILPEDDCTAGVRLMRDADSKKSGRIFNRLNRHGERTPYYEYRDTAMSRSSAFRPEWIKELRLVSDCDPRNPDVAYNNGHLMHQITFFVGPVNFYYEVNGEKRCSAMNTGDSNYITPYWPHSFTTRSESEDAYIVAVTFGGEVKRAQGELSKYTNEQAANYLINVRNPLVGVQELLDHHLSNEFLTRELLQDQLDEQCHKIDVLDRTRSFSPTDIAILARLMNLEAADLSLPQWYPDEEVVVRHIANEPGYLYPDNAKPQYRIFPAARCHRLPEVKAFKVDILPESAILASATDLSSGLHTYIFNYSQASIGFVWCHQNKKYQEQLAPGDSIFVQPFIPFHFLHSGGDISASVFIVCIGGSLNLNAQLELSSFADFDRVIVENKCWFD